VAAVGACDVKKELLEPQNPGIIGPDQVQSPTAATHSVRAYWAAFAQ
jgi:hypothetical protein